MMKPRKCAYCPAKIRMIFTKDKRWTPVHANSTKRMGSAPLPLGKYYDEAGNQYDERSVPNGIKIYKSHWQDCPGANQARQSND